MEQGMESVVGGLTMDGKPAASYKDRWEIETAYFTEAILRHLPNIRTPFGCKILDYGCGCGRIAKALLGKGQEIGRRLYITGVDPSVEQLKLAVEYVGNEQRFVVATPERLHSDYRVDAAVCVYVLQHVPAVELRDAIRIVANALPPGGPLIYVNADVRSAMRFDKANEFFDDRFLGVNVVSEVEKYFGRPTPLFDKPAKEVWLQKLVGMHRNVVYRRL